MKKNKNKMIGMSTGFTLRSLKDLYCTNSIIKTGTMIAGVMLASCANNDNNDNNDKKEKNKVDLNTLTDNAKKNLFKLLGTDVNSLKTRMDTLGLTEDDIKETGELTENGVTKKKNAEVRAKAQITTVLNESIKINSKIDVDGFKQLAKTLKQLVEATQNLLNVKYNNNDNDNDKFLADIKKVADFHKAFCNPQDYKNAIKTAFNAQLNAIKRILSKVNSAELNEYIIASTSDLQLNQRIGCYKISNVISALLDNSNNGNSVIGKYIAAETAKITVKEDGTAKLKLVFGNNDTFDDKGIIAFAEKNRVGGDKIQAITNDFKTKLVAKIKTLQFGTVDTSTTCKTQIINGYIDTVLNFDNLQSINLATITEDSLKKYCGKDNNVVATVDDVKNQIVEPVMTAVFGDAELVKDVFIAVNKLLNLNVGNGKTLKEHGLASICDDINGSPVNKASTANDHFSTAYRLQEALFDIRDAIDAYNKGEEGQSTTVVQEFFKFYFGEVGTGNITDMKDGRYVPSNLEWMRLGKAVVKWVFSKHKHENSEKKMRQDYDKASKALAMSILLNGVTVKDYSDNTKTSNVLTWFNTPTNAYKKINLDLTNDNKGNGLGGEQLTNSNSDKIDDNIKVDFDNMIICDGLATETSDPSPMFVSYGLETNPSDPRREAICIPKMPYTNSWNGAQIVAKDFRDNFNSMKSRIESDFALLALFLGYFNHKTNKMIDIRVKVNNNADQYIYNTLKSKS